MKEGTICGLCNEVALGWAVADGVRLCHDDLRSCYHQWTVYNKRPEKMSLFEAAKIMPSSVLVQPFECDEHHWDYIPETKLFECMKCKVTQVEDPWVQWFRESGNAEYWNNVECIECELGRDCLIHPENNEDN